MNLFMIKNYFHKCNVSLLIRHIEVISYKKFVVAGRHSHVWSLYLSTESNCSKVKYLIRAGIL